MGTGGTAVKDHTAYVCHGFIPFSVKGKVFAGTVAVMETGTHGIPVKYPNHIGFMLKPLSQTEMAIG